MADWAILGCGYVGARLCRALLADGERVRVGARRIDRLAPLGEAGAEVHAFDAARARAFGPLVYGLSSPIVVYSVPPIPQLPAGEAIRRAADACAAVGTARFIYLGSTAVYGETPDGETVDEETPLAVSDPEALPRIGEESAVEMARLAGLSTVVLRLAAIYGPGRGVRERLKAGSYKLIDDGAHYFSRVHVDDLVGVIRAAAARAPAGAVYCVADDRPTTQREYADWLVARLGVAPPPSVPSLAPGAPRRGVRNRKVSNARLKRELGYTFRHPSYVEGELAIERETGVAPSEAAPPEAAPPEAAPPEAAPSEAAPPEVAPPEAAPSEAAPSEVAPPEAAPPGLPSPHTASPPPPSATRPPAASLEHGDPAALAAIALRVEALWLEALAGELAAASSSVDGGRLDEARATLERGAGLLALLGRQRALVPVSPPPSLSALDRAAAALRATVTRAAAPQGLAAALRALDAAAAQLDPAHRSWFAI